MILSLFPDIYKRAPALCEKCEKNLAEFGPYCGECCDALQSEIADTWYKDQQYYKGEIK